jgi:hypothetical protein
LVKLRERLGPDHSTLHDDLAPKLKCSKCGGKKIGDAAFELNGLGQSLHQVEGSVARQITSTSRSASALPSGSRRPTVLRKKPAAGFKEAAGFRPGFATGPYR